MFTVKFEVALLHYFCSLFWLLAERVLSKKEAFRLGKYYTQFEFILRKRINIECAVKTNLADNKSVYEKETSHPY